MRSIALLAACTGALGAAVLLACKANSEGSGPDPVPDEGGIPVADGAPGVDAAPRREAGVPTKCATYAGSTSSDECSCGEDSSPFNGPPTDVCPVNANPHYCVSYDVVTPAPVHRQCTCQPKCIFQRVSGSSGDAGSVDTCRCGVSSHLVLGGDGSKDLSRPSCDGFAVCCRDNSGCDCTSDGSYACPSGSMKVASCTPNDFNVANWKALVYGDPAFTDLIDVDRCR